MKGKCSPVHEPKCRGDIQEIRSQPPPAFSMGKVLTAFAGQTGWILEPVYIDVTAK